MSNSAHTADIGESFVAIDFETATSERNSACAVGAVVFEQGTPTDTLSLLIRPPGNRYDGFNTMIHGIGPSDTRRSPRFPEVWEQVSQLLDGRLVIAHNTAFDLSVLRRSAEHHGYEPDPFPFACTYRIARSAMPDAMSWSLDVLADDFGIPLSHHDPLSDAHAAGLLWLALPERFGTTHADLLASLGYRLGYCHLDGYKPFSNAAASSSGSSKSFSAKDFTPNGEPDPEGLLFSKRIVFTGTLESMPRREAFQAAVDAGAKPSQSVSKRTDHLVLGVTDLRKVGETVRSSKHRKALHQERNLQSCSNDLPNSKRPTPRRRALSAALARVLRLIAQQQVARRAHGCRTRKGAAEEPCESRRSWCSGWCWFQWAA